jgi:hypothetical protein
MDGEGALVPSQVLPAWGPVSLTYNASGEQFRSCPICSTKENGTGNGAVFVKSDTPVVTPPGCFRKWPVAKGYAIGAGWALVLRSETENAGCRPISAPVPKSARDSLVLCPGLRLQRNRYAGRNR